MLAAPAAALGEMRGRARAADVGVVAFPTAGQQTTDYDELRRRVAEIATRELTYLGVALYGSRRAVDRLTGSLRLLR